MALLKTVLLAVLFTTSVWANQTELKKRMMSEIDTVANVYRTMYAPREWKKRFADWDVDVEAQLAKDRIQERETINLKEFQEILRDFVQSTQDYHVSIRFFSTESATLPFAVKSVDGHYYLVYVDRTKLPFSAFPFSNGDELVSMNGIAIEPLIFQIKTEIGNNVRATDQSLAEMFLTRRFGAKGMSVPQGPVTLSVLRRGTNTPVETQLMWEYKPEKIKSFTEAKDPTLPPLKKSNGYDFQMIAADADLLAETPSSGNPYALGSRQSYLPALGLKIWESDASSPFHAYIFQDSKKRLIGYVRIASYSAGSSEAAQFAALIARFQSTTEALIIDQLNNPGGSVFYLYALASMLTDTSLHAPKHRITLNQSMIAEALSNLDLLKAVSSDDDAKAVMGPDVGGYPVSYGFVTFFKQFLQFQIDEWSEGHRLTGPVHLYGVEKINPNPMVHYSKPILLLTNELDFSGGDFFPAILQDNKRVTIMGSRTAGAGGYVGQHEYSNMMGIQMFTTTESIAERVGLHPIENLGVQPEIPYDLTADDVRNGFQDYGRAILKAVDGMIH